MLRPISSSYSLLSSLARFYVVIIALSLMLGCSSGEVLNTLSNASKHLAYKDVAYGDHPRQTMDIYLPNGNSTKVNYHSCKVVFVHGGSWQSGEKETYGFVGAAFAELGYFVAIPNYRLHPEAIFPDFVSDIVSALSHASLTKINPDDKIVLVGHSAGALNAAHVSYNKQHLLAAGLNKSAIDLFVSLAGPHDYFLPSDKPAWRAIFGDSDDQQLQALSVNYVDVESPPTLVLHGESDTVVTPRSALSLADRLKTYNIPHTLKIYDGIGHRRIIGALASPLKSFAPTRQDIKAFLQSHHCNPGRSI